MKLLRGVAATLLFLAGLITLAGALFSVVITLAIAGQTHQPINLSDLAGGLVAGAIGFLLLFISRATDPEGGPVLSYRDRPIKRRARK
jgi:hypothetical protein